MWFVADSSHPAYELIGNVVRGQMYVSTFALHDYPVREEDILCTGGPEAFSVALNTVNVGKFNLCTASIGMCEHAFYEAITHANNRILYGNPVTDFPHVRAGLVDAYARLAAMKLFSDRAVDYFRSASLEDRRYLLFNPATKAKVTSEGEKVVTLLWDIMAAKGFERDTYFTQVTRLIGALPRLEGTVHVNVAQILKFMPNYLLNPAEYPEIAPATIPPTIPSSGRRVRPAARPRFSSPTGRRCTKKPLRYRMLRVSSSRRGRCSSWCSPPRRTRSSSATSTSCSWSVTCSPSWSTAS